MKNKHFLNLINIIHIKYKKPLTFLVLLAIASLFAGCGKTAFNVTPTTQSAAGPGTFMVPPKVDVLLVEDDTGRIQEAYSSIAQQATQFLQQLSQQKWDYHFTAIPLTTFRAIQHVAGSVYDGNNPSWQAPYPGASQFNSDTIAASAFQLSSNFSDFIQQSSVTNAQNGSEPGFQNIQAILQTGLGNTNFLRPDAMLVIIVLGTGNDTSKVNFCTGPDGRLVPCEQVSAPACTPTATDPTGGSTTCASQATSLTYYQNWFQNFKSNSNIQFYAAVAGEATNSCVGGKSSVGSRYQQMASALGGQDIDICSQSVSQVFSSLSSDLQSLQVNFRYQYVIISQQPNVSTIVVTRYPGGNTSSPIVIPQDPNNGWTYAGYVNQVNAIDFPTPMDQVSGYAIQLNGTAQLTGADTISVTYQPAGVQSAVSQ